MLLQILVAFLCVLAGVLQLAAFLSPDTSNQRILNVARRVTAAGMLVAGFHITYSNVAEAGANPMLVTVMGILALGQLLFAMHTFFEPACTERLMAHKYTGRRPNENSHA